MSDISQGPGWWQASDGKWYPPETHPNYHASLPPPTAPQLGGAAAPQAKSVHAAKPWWRRWWVVTLGVVLVLAVVGAVVGSGGSDSETVEEVSEPAETDDIAVETEAAPVETDSPPESTEATSSVAAPVAEESVPTTTTEPAQTSSQDDPTPVGQPLVVEVDGFGDGDGSRWGLRVDGPGVVLNEAIAAANQFNEPPPSGTSFYGVPITIQLLNAGKQPLSPLFNIEIEFFGPVSRSIIGLDLESSCGIVPGEFDQFKEVFAGGAVSGFVCFAVEQADIDAGVLLTSDSFQGDRIFMSTTGSVDLVAEMPPAETKPSSGSSGPGSLDAPIPVGQAVSFVVEGFGDGDGSRWTILVTGPGSDYGQAVAAENQFNDPPPLGHLFYAVPVTLTLEAAGKEPLSTLGNIEFEFFGPSSLSIIGLNFAGSCGVTPGAFDEFKEVFVGGSISGVICFAVGQADADSGVLLTFDSAEGSRLFLATR